MRVQFKKILCATDFSDFSVAIYGEFQLDPVGQQNRIIEDANEQLEALTGDQPVEWEPLITVGKPADEIIRAVEEQGIDLVISATRGRTGLKRLILGSVTERLMLTLPCPLLVLRSSEHDLVSRPDQAIRLKKILVGCDFSPDSGQALNHALSLAQEFEAELHLINVIEAPAQPGLLKGEISAAEKIQADFRQLLSLQKPVTGAPRKHASWRVSPMKSWPDMPSPTMWT